MHRKRISTRYKHFRPVKRPTEYYVHYEKLMDDQDKEMLKIMNSNLDILLIFAALFSSVNSGFIALSVALFNPSPSETTNTLLRYLVTRTDNLTLTDDRLYPPPSPPPAGTTRVNCLFCASLAISLVVSLGSIIGKQWLIYYDRSSEVDPFQDRKSWRPLGSEHRGRERYKKLSGLQKWRLRAILEAWLPMMLQLSVLVFFIGLIDFLHLTKAAVGWVTLSITGVGVLAYLYSVWEAARNEDCPFQTPVSTIVFPWMVSIWHWVKPFLSRFRQSVYRGISEIPGVEALLDRLERGEETPRAEPVEETPDSNSVSTIDIQVASWMLSTAMKPEYLRSAAWSLPLVHVPQEQTSLYVDPSAISHLLFLFRDSIEALDEYQTPQASAIPNAIVYSRAAFHLFLSSYIHYRFTSSREPIVWWGTYLEVLSSAVTRKPIGRLQNHERLVRLIKDGTRGRNIFSEPPVDPISLPLYMAGLTIAWVTCHHSIRNQDLFQIGDFWKSIDRCFRTTSGEPTDAAKSIASIPWNAINLAAWALSEFHDGGPRDADGQHPDPAVVEAEAREALSGTWNAYTSDEHIWKHIIDALEKYEERINVSNEYRRDVKEVYVLVLNAIPSLIKQADDSTFVQSARDGHPARLRIATNVLHHLDESCAADDPKLIQSTEAQNTDIRLLAAALDMFFDNNEQVKFTDDEVQPLWEAISPTPSNISVHRILLNFLQRCLRTSDFEADRAIAVFDRHPNLATAIINGATHENEEVRLAALRTIQHATEKIRAGERTGDTQKPLGDERYLAKILVDSCKKSATISPRAKRSIRSTIKKLATRSKTPSNVLNPFYDNALDSPAESNATEMALEIWQMCHESSLSDDPRWMSEAMVGAVADHAQWRLSNAGNLDDIMGTLHAFWDAVSAHTPTSTAFGRLSRVLDPQGSPEEPVKDFEKGGDELEVESPPGPTRVASTSYDPLVLHVPGSQAPTT